jgi:adenylylsulfate reductase, subunit A
MMKHTVVSCDVLVIGGGMAGSNAALAAAEAGVTVTVMEKAAIERSGDVGGGVDHFLAFLEAGEPWDTREAFLDHIWDAGGGTGDPAIIDSVCCSGLKDAIDRMAAIGVPLTQPDGRFYRTRSFGQPGPYFINFNGKKLKPALAREVRRRGCRVLDKTMALDLIMEDGGLSGAAGFNIRTGELYIVQARAVVICTGDSSRLFQNPRVNPFNSWASPFNTGDGQSMAYRAGAKLANMEFMRLSLTPKGFAAAGFNAFMGMGCRLMNGRGDYFMEKLKHGGNPPRNAAVYYALKEVQAGRGPVYVDCRHLKEKDMSHLYATLGYDKDTLPDYLEQRKENLRTKPMEIFLSDGSQGGVSSVTGAGICIDRQASASIPGLFAAGNCADHNRGLWAATTGGYFAGRKAASFAKREAKSDWNESAVVKSFSGFQDPLAGKQGMSHQEAEDTIRLIMFENCGYIRSEKSLSVAAEKLEALETHIDTLTAGDPHELMRCHETRSILVVSRIMVEAARYRKESRMQPFHCREDYPETNDDQWFGLVEIKKIQGKPSSTFRPLKRSA